MWNYEASRSSWCCSPWARARYWSRPDVAWLPFHDFEPLTYALVWHAEAENDVVHPLAQTVRDLGPLHLGLS